MLSGLLTQHSAANTYRGVHPFCLDDRDRRRRKPTEKEHDAHVNSPDLLRGRPLVISPWHSTGPLAARPFSRILHTYCTYAHDNWICSSIYLGLSRYSSNAVYFVPSSYSAKSTHIPLI